jgi:hypothetical protein
MIMDAVQRLDVCRGKNTASPAYDYKLCLCTMPKDSKFRTWNIEYSGRKAGFEKGMDWKISKPAHQPSPLTGISLSKNMFAFEQQCDKVYKRLVKYSDEVKSAGNLFSCWIPNYTGIEIQDSGYRRLNFLRTDVQCHVFSYLYWNPGLSVEADDISHLCGNPGCCRYSHLCVEPRDYNISRRSCIGWLLDTESGQLFNFCRHQPFCKIVREINAADALIPTDNYPSLM